jgi:arginyl-tRNA--protein-N-Asp/Glu arginylyltransferase
MAYLKWNEKLITDFSDENIEGLYDQGYLFGRQEKGSMYQTRSVRIDLSKFELNSENRRILRKTEDIQMAFFLLPFPDYHWSIGKLAKDFYDTKFGDGTFSANKIKELLTDPSKSNFNAIFTYFSNKTVIPTAVEESLGYSIALATTQLIHYSYPFYNLETSAKDMGLGMMTRAAVYAKEQNKKYLYLGSAQRPNDTYKFQFDGIEWFDGENWQTDFEQLKNILQNI